MLLVLLLLVVDLSPAVLERANGRKDKLEERRGLAYLVDTPLPTFVAPSCCRFFCRLSNFLLRSTNLSKHGGNVVSFVWDAFFCGCLCAV